VLGRGSEKDEERPPAEMAAEEVEAARGKAAKLRLAIAAGPEAGDKAGADAVSDIGSSTLLGGRELV